MRLESLRFEQHGESMYTVVMSAKDLVAKTKVDIWYSNNPEGYQRAPEDSRARSFMRFVASHEISPMAVLANIREEDRSKVKVGDGWIDIPDGVCLWLVDGQHRVRGLQMLLEASDKQAELQIPAIITLGQPLYQEAKQFVIVNRTQKKVRTDLGERFLQRAVKEEGMTNVHNKGLWRGIEWVPTAISVADILNNDEHSVWHNKIRLPNEPKGLTIANQKSFTDSLKPIINPPEGPLSGKPEGVIAAIMNHFWDAIKELCPIPIEDPADHVMQKSTGVFVLHAIMPRVYMKTGKEAPTKNDFVKVLDRIDSLKKAEKWHQDGAYGRMMGQKAFRIMTLELLDELETSSQKVSTK